MFSTLVKSASKMTCFSPKFCFASSTKGGNLFTWGTRSAGLGLEAVSGSEHIETPQKVQGFHNNVAKVAMGPTHTAVVTTDGELYTFGYGANGVLGHGEHSANLFAPQIVQYFNDNDIKVRDVAVGAHHTAALTEKGEVYTWGFGGKSRNPIKNWFNPSNGALGQSSNTDLLEPTLIEDAKFGPNGSITSGYNFVSLLNEKSDIYNWGVGKSAVFAEESQRNISTPTINDAIKHAAEEEGAKVVKIKAAANHILALLDNGALYGWGNNELGQLGIKKDVGIELYNEIDHPTKLDMTNIKSKKVTDFDCGEELSIIRTDDGEAYWFGLKLAIDAEQIVLPEGVKAKSVHIINPYYLVVAENNDMWSNSSITPKDKLCFKTGLYKVNTDAFNSGQILEVGGQYLNRFAIVKN